VLHLIGGDMCRAPHLIDCSIADISLVLFLSKRVWRHHHLLNYKLKEKSEKETYKNLGWLLLGSIVERRFDGFMRRARISVSFSSVALALLSSLLRALCVLYLSIFLSPPPPVIGGGVLISAVLLYHSDHWWVCSMYCGLVQCGRCCYDVVARP
jgi:hypothetical protein